MPNWTEMQEAAISANGASVVVSAAAGSGKTAVLVERIIRLLENEQANIKAENMIVATYTNDAAAEVRQRLNLALTKRVASRPDDRWLRRQLTLLPSMNVSTIHSFCFQLLRTHAAQLEISSGFRVMDDTEETALRKAVIAQTLEAFSSEAAASPDLPTDQQMLLDAFCTADDKPLEDVLLTLYQTANAVPFGETLLDASADACTDGSVQNAAANAIRSILEQALDLQHRALALYDTLESADAEKMAKSKGILSDETAQTQKWIDALGQYREDDFAALADALRNMTFARFDLPRKDIAIIPAVRALRSRAKALLSPLSDWVIPLQFAREDLPRHAALLRICSRLVQQFSQMLTAEKQARNAIGFDDALTLSLSLLAERKPDGTIVKTELAEQLSQHYDCLLIDEFQDADNLKEMIFRMLSRGGSQTQYGNNLFVVGDSKQCIYRFQNANPENFYRAMQEGAPYHTPVLTQNTRIDLNRNFRSCGEVIGFINHVFSQLMTEQVGEVTYDDTQKLVQGMPYPDIPGGRPVEIMLLGDDADEPRAVAQRIAWHLYVNHTPVMCGGQMLPCAPKDFLILLRKKKHMQAYADALKEVGVPVCAIGQDNYLDAPEITLLLDILRAIDNPLLEVPVAAVLLSPIFGFSLDDLTAVRVSYAKTNLFPAMQKLAADETADTALRQKCAAFLSFMENMRLCSAMDTPEQLIRRIYQQTDFLGMMQMTDGGAQKKANLRSLLSYAHSFEQNVGGGLSALLRSVDTTIERSGKLKGGGIPAASANVVSIKTIHASKGLEAPFVIAADLKQAFSKEDEKKICRYHPSVGIGFQLYDKEALSQSRTLPWKVIADAAKKEAVSEELRLFYVALTRAREYLILPMDAKNSDCKRAAEYAAEQSVFGGTTDLMTGSVSCMAYWLLMALVRNPACEQLRRTMQIECDTDPKQPLLDVYIFSHDPAGDPADTAAEPDNACTQQQDPLLLETMQKQCQWYYESKTVGLTAKYGVSELAKEEDFSAPLRRPLFVREQHGLSGAERGTAVHTFLQYADFNRAAADLSSEIVRLRTAGRLTKKQADAVAKSNVSSFFSSALYQRIANALDVRREQKFTVRLSDLHLTGSLAQLGEQYQGTAGMLIGIMDLVFEEEDGIVLVDYKTDTVSHADDLLEKYTEQIRLYAEALRLLDAKPVKACYLYSIARGETVPVTL